MPYITTEKVKEIRDELKRTFPQVKFSVTREHYSSVKVRVMASPYKWEKDYMQLNPFYPEKAENPEFVTAVVEIARRDVRTVSEDGDYGSIPNYYVDVHVGAWNRPHIQI